MGVFVFVYLTCFVLKLYTKILQKYLIVLYFLYSEYFRILPMIVVNAHTVSAYRYM